MRTFLVSRRSQAEAVASFLRAQPTEPPFQVAVGPIPRGPTPEQHRRYRQLCRLAAEQIKFPIVDADGVVTAERRYDAEAWHLYFKRQYLDPETVELPGGALEEALPSTAELTPAEMVEFTWKVMEFCGERGVFLASPE